MEVSPRTVSDVSPRDPPEEVSSVSEQAWDPYQVGNTAGRQGRGVGGSTGQSRFEIGGRTNRPGWVTFV